MLTLGALVLLTASTTPTDLIGTVGSSSLHLEPWTCDMSQTPRVMELQLQSKLVNGDGERTLPRGTVIYHPRAAKVLNTCLSRALLMHVRANERIDAAERISGAGVEAARVAYVEDTGWSWPEFLVGTGVGAVVVAVSVAVAVGLAR